MKITIGWLYPSLMSTYGDRGNIVVLKKRAQWRDIDVSVVAIDHTVKQDELKKIDLLFGGGAQDREQALVMTDLMKKKRAITDLIEKHIPALFVCGAPQLMGKYYEPAAGKRIEGLGIFDMISKHPGPNAERLIGNIAAEVLWENFSSETINHQQPPKNTIVGFENHGGRTYLGDSAKPFARVLKGNGNNGTDRTEGIVRKNAIGCYFHGPLLPKNPAIADWLLKKSLEIKYHQQVNLIPLDDTLELAAQNVIATKLGVGV